MNGPTVDSVKESCVIVKRRTDARYNTQGKYASSGKQKYIASSKSPSNLNLRAIVDLYSPLAESRVR